MRHSLSLLILLISFSLNAQELYHIPDANFLAYLHEVHPELIVNDSLDVITAAGVTSINCNSREIESLDGLQYFTDLTWLDCSYNQLTSLPELPIGLTWLVCRSNQLTSLPELPADLITRLYCQANQLTSLPELPVGLTQLSCFGNQLTNLPELPLDLHSFECGNNQLTSLPELPLDLTSLSCYSNLLTNLPELPIGLTWLQCNANQLTNLPELPVGLTMLSCRSNQLTSLPELPIGLTVLFCSNNLLTNLPELALGLIQLSCFFNQLTVLPVLPEGLNTLQIDSTLIECVQYYPEQLEEQLGEYPICIEGCLDSTHYNYSDTVQVDDGSCISYMYMVDSLAQLNTDALDSISNLHIELETWNSTIELTLGWNMVGYGCPEPTDLIEALYMYEESIVIMKDNNGSVYMPEFGFNGIGDLTPGYGYQLKVTDYILDFNICE